MSSSTVMRLVIAVLLALGAWWFVSATEWAEVEVNTPARGEAQRNRLFALELLVKQLGGRFEKHENLDAMPPAGAVLVLESRYWDLFPERAERLRRWVEGGGHLVLPGSIADEYALAKWLPVELAERPKSPPGKSPRCRTLAEASGAAEGTPYRLCIRPYWQELRMKNAAAPLWAVQGASGIELLRAAYGRGTVTVYGPYNLLHNDEVVRADSDHAAAAAAALQMRRDGVLWLVPDEARPPLLAWVWQQGWAAVLLALAAGAAWLWRATVRFGPVGVVPPVQRRSMREQVAGTAAFLRRHGPASLHTAQVRALHEAARARLPGYARLQGLAAVECIARATGLPAPALQSAFAAARPGRPTLAADLELLELARRRLTQSTSHFSSQP